jgi:8-oxo-dGTP pyrophosphatase MutT (NUDIX family)
MRMLHRCRKVAQPRLSKRQIIRAPGRENAEKGVNMTASLSRPSPLEFHPAVLADALAARLPQRPDSEMPPAGTQAAVLIPVVARREPVLLFTRRTESLTRHSGQVSFPGGRMEADDASLLATALRETAEETGIAPQQVHMAGYLSRLLTVTGFDVQPVVGVLQPGFILRPDPAEVAAVFEVPLAFFADPANRVSSIREWKGRPRTVTRFVHDGHEIWGATASIIVDLVTRLNGISS